MRYPCMPFSNPTLPHLILSSLILSLSLLFFFTLHSFTTSASQQILLGYLLFKRNTYMESYSILQFFCSTLRFIAIVRQSLYFILCIELYHINIHSSTVLFLGQLPLLQICYTHINACLNVFQVMVLGYRNGNMFMFTRKRQLFINVVPLYSYLLKVLSFEETFKFIKHLQNTAKMVGIFSPPLQTVNVANFYQLIFNV